MLHPPSFVIRLLATAAITLAGWINPALQSPPHADWCQCVIFTLNLLGIQQIPGEYWTATSLVVPDKSGKTWMDYQGYKRRGDGELPDTGDLLVLSGGAEVVTVQTWSGSEHLVPVPVDVWAGHMGIVLQAEQVEKEGNPYIQVQLMSANWGVLAQNLGVVGSCFNVDESTFLIPMGYSKAGFFQPADPVKMRERMVNRANRWALLGLSAGTVVPVDGFPINPSGFVSYVMEPVNSKPLVPAITNVAENLVEIPAEVTQAGDFILFGKDTEPGMGMITQVAESEPETYWKGQVTYLSPGGRVTGPVDWDLLYKDNHWVRQIEDGAGETVHFLRYRNIPGYTAITNMKVSPGQDPLTIDVAFSVVNGGASQLEPGVISLQIYPMEVGQITPAVNPPVLKKEVRIDHAPIFSESIHVSENMRVENPGNYHLVVQTTSPDGFIQDLGAIDLTVP